MTYSYHDLLSLKSPLLVVVLGCLLVESLGVNGKVTLSLGTTPLANNSVVVITEIGRYYYYYNMQFGGDIEVARDGSPLICTTTFRPCCGSQPNRHGEWYFPDGTQVDTNNAGGDFYRNRNDDPGRVLLHRRNNAMSPTGTYYCEIPLNSATDLRRLTVRVSAFSVSLALFGTPITAEQYQLNCTVTGSTDTPTFTWLGPPSNTLLPSDTRMVSGVMSSGSTHTSILQFDPIQSSHEGMYTCQVTVGTATEMRSTQVNVEAPIITGNTGGQREVIERTNYGLPLFDVTVEGVDELSFQSSKDGVNISDGVKYKIIYFKTSLDKWGFWLNILPPLTPEDTGDYRVILSYTGGTTTLDTKSVTVYIDECARRTDDCVSGANCVKVKAMGSFTCTCPFDFTGDGRTSGTGCIIPIFLNPSGTPIAGEQYQLNCTVTVTGSTDPPTFTWLGPPSNTSLPRDTRMVSGVMSSGSTHTSILQLDPIQSSHEGMYTCQVTVGTVTDMRSTQVNVEEPVITAMVSASGTPTVGQSYSLTCTVTGADRLNPTVAYKWFKVYPELEVGKDLQTLSFSILSQSDAGEYRCDVAVSSTLLSHRIRVTGLLYNLIAPTPNITAIVSGSTPTVGQSYSLTCTVTGADRLNPTITYKWLKVSPKREEVGKDSQILSFPKLSQSEAGEYRCDVAVSSTLLSHRIRVTSLLYNLIAPTPNITAIVSGSTPTVGQSYSLTCTVTGADRLNPTISYKWFKINPESEVGNNSRILSFPSLRLSDAGQYRCAVTLKSDLLIRRIGASSKPQQLRIPTVLFQFRLNGIPKCFDWALTDTTAKALEITDILVQAVEQGCECGFTRGHITEDAFQCFPESMQHVTFRARLTETSQATTPQLITHIEQWVVSTRTIPIQHFRLGINSTCGVVVNEFDSPECLERDTQDL